MRIILKADERAEIEALAAVFATRKGYPRLAEAVFARILPAYRPSDTYEACMVAAAILAHAETED